MIIFYNKTTGEIKGTVDGRVTSEDHLKMWIGNKDENDRIIVNWEPVRSFNIDGEEVSQGDTTTFTSDFEPNHPQKEIFIEIDKNKSLLKEYKIDLKTKNLVKK